jgi:sarcosine oxidase
MQRVDVIVVGLGAVGSAAIYHLAKQGLRVRGFDSYHPPHSNGSSHGETRITRLAIGEGAEYTPLAMRSHELWAEIHRETGVDLLVACGGLIISNRSEAKESHGVAGFLDNTVRAAQKYKIPHEELSAADIRRRFPQFRVADHEEAYFEPSAGYLRVEACIEAQLKLARERYGAELHTDTRVETYRTVPGGVEVITASGAAYHADQLLVSAGAWLPKLVKLDPPYNDLFKVTRQVMHWYDVPAPRERFAPPAFPVFIWEPAGKAQPIYGFPLTSLDASSGVKIATEGKDVVDPDAVDRTEPQARIDAAFQEYFGHCFPDFLPGCLKTRVCLYTEVEGGRFVIDRVPGNDRVLFASACSGHGFKHSAALGEALAQTLTTGRSAVDLSPFTLANLMARRARG